MPSPPMHKKKTWVVALAGVVAASVIVSLFALLVISLSHEEIPGYIVEAQRARDAQDLGAERAALEALKESDPHHIKSLEDLARIAREEGRLIDAAKQWGEVAVLDPMHATARFEQARNLYAAGDYRTVIELLSRDSLQDNPDARALYAMALFSTGRADEAEAVILRTMAVHPGHTNTLLLHADRLFLDDQLEAAETVYRKLLDSKEVAGSAHFGLVQIHVRRGEPERAVALMHERPADTNDSYQLLSAHAEFWRQTGHLDEAVETYQRLLRDYGPLPEIVVPLAEVTASRGEKMPITELRSKLAGTTAPALAARHYLLALEAYLDKDPGAALQRLSWAEGYYGRRDLYRWVELDSAVRLGNEERARAAVEGLQRMNLAPLRRGHAADLAAVHAAHWADRGKYEKAEVLAGLALELSPDHAAARLVIARAALVGGREEEAAELARPLLQDDGLRPAALEVLGRADMETGDMKAAEQHFRELVQALPESSIGPYWLGVNLYRQGDYPGAIEQLRTAYQRNPEPRVSASLLDALIRAEDWSEANDLAEEQIAEAEAPARALGWAYKAGIYRARGELDLAAEAYQKAMEEQPERLAYALAAADLLIDVGELEQAKLILDTAAQQAPENRVLRFKRGYLAQLMGETGIAAQYYRDLLSDFPSWALVMVNLSELLGATEGSRTEALEMAGRAAELTPGWDEAHWNLAQRAMEAGKEDQARQSALRVVEISPEHGRAVALIARLGGE